MDNLTPETVKAQIKAKEEDFEKFAKEAQDDLAARNQKLQQDQSDIQALLRSYQSEVDKRAGAIESLKALIEDKKDNTPKVLPKPKTKK